ncbi:hypothetical protein GTP91_03445 [Rugamonas sp. FT82W]|uniref:LamG domain-containing protein n=1 Tax=Duganella vulcania TaxID=2692166 RepID=A0A845FXF0_9BURK|nr:heparin lyase I family protein [Duganella vulcania]MYM86231.1 hypothetical protein [Duganella vulcania]
MPISRYALLLGIFGLSCLAQGAAQASDAPPPQLSGFQGLTNSTFPASYQFLATPGGVKSFVADPMGASTKSFVQLSLSTGATQQQAMIAPSSAPYATGPVRWYGFSIYLPSGWRSDAGPVTVARIASNNPALPPPLALVVDDQDLKIVLSANHRDPASSEPPTAANTQTRSFALSPAVAGQWHCVVIKAVWSGNVREGETHVWVNGQATTVYDAVRTHNSYKGAVLTPQVGLSTGATEQTIPRMAVVDAVILGNSTAYPGLLQKYMPCPIPAQ